MGEKFRKNPLRENFHKYLSQSLGLQKIVELLNRVAEKAYKWGKFLVSELTEYAGINHLEIFEKPDLKKLHVAFDDFGSIYTNFQLADNNLSRYKSSFVKVNGKTLGC